MNICACTNLPGLIPAASPSPVVSHVQSPIMIFVIFVVVVLGAVDSIILCRRHTIICPVCGYAECPNDH